MLRAGNLVLDIDSRRASLAAEPVLLTYREFEVLAVLADRLDCIVPYITLCHSLWGSTGAREVKRLAVLISNLREKLGGLSPYTIANVRFRGYGLVLADA